MKSLLFLLLCCAICSCTANAQTATDSVNNEKHGSCTTAQPFCPPAYASNIIESEKSIMACFENHTVIFGKTWNCLALYEGDDNLIYFGDGDKFWIDSANLVLSGTNAEVQINVSAGTATATVNGINKTMSRPTYNGAVSPRSN